MSLWLVIFLPFGIVGKANAQSLFKFVPNKARLELMYRGSWRTSLVNSNFRQNNLEERLVLPFDGSLLDPGLLRYSFEFRPTFSQQNTSTLPTPLLSRGFGYSAETTLLSARSVSLSARWSRSNGVRNGGFGTRGVYQATDFSSTVHSRNPYLPISATITRHSGTNANQVGPQLKLIAQSSAVRSFRATAHNRKIDAVFHRSEIQDRLDGRKFVSQNIQIGHRFRWGKRSELISRYRVTERRGDYANQRASWVEKLRIQHTQSTYSLVHFNWNRSTTLGRTATGKTAGWSMSSRISPWMNLGGRATYSKTSYRIGNQNSSLVGPWASFRYDFPMGLNISGGGSLGYLKRDDIRIDSDYAQAISEKHFVDQSLLVVLDNFRVDREHILIQSEDEQTVFVDGLDYLILPGGDLTTVQIRIGSRIEPGANIVVSYRYAVLADTKEQGIIWGYNIGVRFAGIFVRHTQSRRNTSFSGEGEIRTSGDFDNTATSISTNKRLKYGRVRVFLGRRERTTVNFSFESNEIRLSWAVQPNPKVSLSLDGLGRRVQESGSRLEIYSFGTSVVWTMARNLILRGNANSQHWKQLYTDESGISVSPATQIFTASLSLSFRIGRTETLTRFDLDKRTLPFESTGKRISISLSRRF